MDFTRPIAFFDIEATGPVPLRDRIVEIAVLRREPNGQTRSWTQRVNPGVPIPSEVIAVHHITNDDVRDKPPFGDIALTLLDMLDSCDFAGFGVVRFDVPILIEEFKRCGMPFSVEDRAVFDGLTIFHQKERRDLGAAYQFYCQKTLLNAHSAEADTQASMEVFFAQLERYKDLPQDRQGLHAFCNRRDERFIDSQRKFIWRDGEAAINFGKHKGELLRTLVQTQRDYIEWMTIEGKFAQDVVDICWRALNGDFPKSSRSSTTVRVITQTTEIIENVNATDQIDL